MKKLEIGIAIIFGIFILILIIGGLSVFNTYMSLQNKFNTDRQVAISAQGDLEAQMQRRFDIISETVGAVKGALTHEQKVFDDIAKQQAAFTQAHDAGNVQGELNANAAAGAAIGQALKGYFVVQQQYPQEFALQNVKDLQTNINGSEDRISVARQRYNDATRIFDTEIGNVPGAWFNSIFYHYSLLPYYKNDAEANKAPKVDLGQ